MSENINENIENPGENTNNAMRKKRRKRPVLEDNNNDPSENPPHEGDNNDSNLPKREPRRRRRKENRNSEGNLQTGPLGVTAYLEDLQDDIEIKVNSDDAPIGETMTMSKGKTTVLHGTGDKVYIEGVRNFRVENHDRYVKNKLKSSQKQAEKLKLGMEHDNDLLQCSIGATDRFRIFATFLHGLFAGMTLMHLVFVLVTGGSTDTAQRAFLAAYTTLQQPYSIFNYVAFIIISISLWDRIDVGERSHKFSQSQAGILVALILTMIAFVINNSLYLFNQDFNNYASNASTLSTLVVSFGSWRVLDAVKSVLICVGWFIIALIPIYDKFIEHLNESMEQELRENY